MADTVEIKIQDRLEIMKKWQLLIKKSPSWQGVDINSVEKVIYEKHKHENTQYLGEIQVVTTFLEHSSHLPLASAHLAGLLLKGHSLYQVIQTHRSHDLSWMEHHL